MNKLPTNYTKEEFIEFLKENGIHNGELKRIDDLPETLEVNQKKYILNIIASWREENDTEYEFELNYYSPDNMEFLFNYKIFNNIHSSLNFIEREIENLN